jgi:acetyltransferase
MQQFGSPKPGQCKLFGHFRARDGTGFLIRPARPDDNFLFQQFLKKISADDLQLKFFGAVNLNDESISRITNSDAKRGLTLVLVCEKSGEMVGFARLCRAGKNAEYAILVRSDLKNHGYGWHLMQALIDYACIEGIEEIAGEVLARNASMLQMCAEFGFDIAACPEDGKVRVVKLRLPQRQSVEPLPKH